MKQSVDKDCSDMSTLTCMLQNVNDVQIFLLYTLGCRGLSGPFRPFAVAIKTCSSSSLSLSLSRRRFSAISGGKNIQGTGESIRYAPYFRYAWIRSAWGLHPKK